MTLPSYYTEKEIRRAWHRATERIEIYEAAREPMIPSTISLVMEELRHPSWREDERVTVKEVREAWGKFGFDPDGLIRFLKHIMEHRRD